MEVRAREASARVAVNCLDITPLHAPSCRLHPQESGEDTHDLRLIMRVEEAREKNTRINGRSRRLPPIARRNKLDVRLVRWIIIASLCLIVCHLSDARKWQRKCREVNFGEYKHF